MRRWEISHGTNNATVPEAMRRNSSDPEIAGIAVRALPSLRSGRVNTGF
jgi:hypothetical protein